MRLSPIMKKLVAVLLFGAWAAATAGVWPVEAQEPAAATDGATYTPEGQVVRPVNYREWIFLSSSLGMTYGPEQPASDRPPLFDNVFVNPESYRAFKRTGRWPERTMLVLELRRGEVNASINNGGRTQGPIAAIEAAVKDSVKFAATGGWASMGFGPGDNLQPAVTPLPNRTDLSERQNCYACHSRNTAVDNTFVQFYPELFEVAKKMGTVKATYDPARKAQ
jgi:hypothetical protein